MLVRGKVLPEQPSPGAVIESADDLDRAVLALSPVLQDPTVLDDATARQTIVASPAVCGVGSCVLQSASRLRVVIDASRNLCGPEVTCLCSLSAWWLAA